MNTKDLVQIRIREKEKGERTLCTRTVPANPLRPAIPRGGGKAQSSPTITVYKEYSVILSINALNYEKESKNEQYLYFVTFRFRLLSSQTKVQAVTSVVL